MRQTLDDFESVSERHALSPARLSAHQYALMLEYAKRKTPAPVRVTHERVRADIQMVRDLMKDWGISSKNIDIRLPLPASPSSNFILDLRVEEKEPAELLREHFSVQDSYYGFVGEGHSPYHPPHLDSGHQLTNLYSEMWEMLERRPLPGEKDCLVVQRLVNGWFPNSSESSASNEEIVE